MSNISLVEWFRAENPTGLKPSTEAAEVYGGRGPGPLVSSPSVPLAGLGVASLGPPWPLAVRHMLGRGAFRTRLKEDRKDLWTKRK